ncbi:MAG TPA: glycosyltransferase [Anaerolineales bacterium]|nr:glycosyltransferase [Anaerolineales bacterium]
MSIRVSVVVPTYKRPDLLRKCLHALLRQDFPLYKYEIIVVDDAGSEETRSLVEDFQGREKVGERRFAKAFEQEAIGCPPIRYAAATLTQGPAAARNIGWRMAQGEIIAFTDDDCLPESGWLREGLTALKKNRAAVTGQVIVPISHAPTDYEKNVARLRDCEFLTANCFCRRSILEECGGFDERFTMAWREDSDLQFRLLSSSHPIEHAPAARVIHPVRPAPWGVCIKEQRKSMFDALLYKKYPDLYRSRIRSGPPLRYYGIVLSTAGSLVGILVENRWLAVLMAVIWLGLVLHFAFLRLRHTKRTPSHIVEMLFTSAVIPYLSVFWRLYGAFRYRVLFF